MSLLSQLRRLPGLPALALAFLLVACDSPEERVEKHYQSGLELMEQGEFNKAVLEFRNAIQIDEDHAPSHYQMGLIYENRNNLPEAYRRYLKVVDLEPDNIDARIKLVRLFMVDGSPGRALTEIEVINRLDPNVAEVHALLAAIKIGQNDLPAAKEAIDRALALDPDNIDAVVAEASYLFRSESYDEAMVKVNAALEKAPDSIPLHVIKLQTLEKIGDPEAIGNHLALMVEKFPESPQFRQTLVNWAIQNDQPEQAEEQLRALVAAQPGERKPIFDLVRFLRLERGDGEARLALVNLIEASDDPFPLKLMLAQFDVETGDTERAIEELEVMIEDPGQGNANKARVALARILYNEGEEERSDQMVRDTLKADKRDVEALILMTARLIDQGDLENATQTVRRGLDEAPDNVQLLQLAGRAQELAGNLDLANDRLASAVRAANFDAEAVERYVQFLMRTVRFTAAETVLTEAVARNRNNADLIDLLGFTKLRLQNWVGAEEAAQALDNLNPERAKQLRAAILLGQERFDEGISLLRDLPSDERRRAASVSALMQAYIRDGKLDEAVLFIEGLLKENPEDLQALGLRGNLYMAEGDFTSAEASFRTILEIDPKNGGAHSALARLYQLQGNEEAAEQTLLSGLEASPDSLILLARLAIYREGQGRIDEAIELYERLYKQVPDSLLVANNLSSLLSDHRSGDPVELERAYTIASRLRPSDLPQYRDTYGWTRYLKGEYEEALERIAPVVDALPANPWVHYHLGMVYAALDRPEEARPHLEQALALAGNADFPPRATITETLGKI
ncbi:tetratricopeptide repeat protein [Rhodobacteraceae bacterium NNCM2]|nr:tetratricopeptide repeat protein [Coraliihabitans acroporae]